MPAVKHGLVALVDEPDRHCERSPFLAGLTLDFRDLEFGAQGVVNEDRLEKAGFLIEESDHRLPELLG